MLLMSRNRLAGLSLAMLMALFLTMSVGTRVMGKQPSQRATGDIPAGDPTPPRDGMFVGPKSPSYQQLTPAAKGLYAVMREGFGIRSVGGWRPFGSVEGSDHPHGRAIDAMVDYSNPEGRALGWRIAKGGRPRRHLRRQVCDLQRPHLDQVPRLARVPAPIEPVQLRPDPAPRRPRPHLGASLKARHPPLLPLARNRRHRRPAQRADTHGAPTRAQRHVRGRDWLPSGHPRPL